MRKSRLVYKKQQRTDQIDAFTRRVQLSHHCLGDDAGHPLAYNLGVMELSGDHHSAASHPSWWLRKGLFFAPVERLLEGLLTDKQIQSNSSVGIIKWVPDLEKLSSSDAERCGMILRKKWFEKSLLALVYSFFEHALCG